MTLVTMSEKELSRVAVMQDLVSGRLAVDGAASLLGLTRRQVFRLRKSFLVGGPAATESASGSRSTAATIFNQGLGGRSRGWCRARARSPRPASPASPGPAFSGIHARADVAAAWRPLASLCSNWWRSGSARRTT